MATTVHIPDELLSRVDKRARAKQVSRNRFVVQALRKAVEEDEEWSSDFLDAINHTHSTMGKAVDEMMDDIHKNRRSKKPVDL